MEYLIDIRGVSKTYMVGSSEVQALRDVSIQIRPGEFVALTGSSGSGKSTLLHIMGFLDRPDSGEYIFSGSAVHGLSDSRLAAIRAGMVGFVFQAFHLLPRTTARDNVLLPMVYAGDGTNSARADECLAQVGLSDRSAHKSNELSGGQRQRVAIARSLANNPLVLFADEPTGKLDAKSRGEVMALFRDLSARGLTIVMVTHDPEVAAEAHRIVHVKDGVIVSDQATKPAGTGNIIQRRLGLPKARVGFSLSELREQMRVAFVSILNHKMRSALTMLGMFIGVGAVIALMTISDGFMRSLISSTGGADASNLWVVPAEKTSTRFSMDDIRTIKDSCPYIESAKPGIGNSLKVTAGKKNADAYISGGDGIRPGEKPKPGAPKVLAGRMFSSEEDEGLARVAVLSEATAKKLFEKGDAVNQEIRINGGSFQVVGVLEESQMEKAFGGRLMVTLPFHTALKRVFGQNTFAYIELKAAGPEIVNDARTQVILALRRAHPLQREDKGDVFEVRTFGSMMRNFEAMFGKFSIVIYCIAGVSLLVGGIGIMNIMLVSVTERTREIGLRKALGARSSDILTQFLIESVVLCVCGGALGVAFGMTVAWILFFFIKIQPVLKMTTILFAFLFSSLIGVTFGMWPAARAARLDPVEALRYE